MNPQEPVRLSKRMAELKLCSRREADGYIEQGWVKVNGQTAVLGQKVTAADRVELITAENRWDGDTSRIPYRDGHKKGLAPAGRLDIDSVGLLVLTQDGRIAKQLISGDSGIEKEYLVRVKGRLSEEGLRLLNHGLSLDGEKLRPAKVEWQNEDQLRFILKQGKKRQIRRMCELVGLRVTGLKRIRMGQVKLGALPPGKWRYLGKDERF